MTFPRNLQIGSGAKFKDDFLNVDINESRRVDVVMDISAPLPLHTPIKTARFGDIELSHGCFDYVLSEHVFEHIPNLVDTMTNCMNLLADGGIIEIEVPYDLSFGAWMDPTHVRAFNELSWLYYCEEAWYLGWRTHRFDIIEHQFLVTSDYGKDILAQHGGDVNRVRAMPRVIEQIRVRMKKRPYTADEIAAHEATFA